MATTKSVRIQTPGKLYLAGEYNVLEPYHGAVLLAVDRYLTVTSQAQEPKQWTVNSSALGQEPYQYAYFKEEGKLREGDLSDPWAYVDLALRMGQAYLQALGRPLGGLTLTIDSELMDTQGAKYGFGSSGAVVLGVLEALIGSHGIDLSDRIHLYKLAALGLYLAGSQGSFGDLASLTLGGWVYYQNFDRTWLQGQMNSNPRDLLALLDQTWPGLILEPLTLPADLSLEVAWTQAPASTENLVGRLLTASAQAPEAYQAFLEKGQALVQDLRQAFQDQTSPALLEALATYGQLMTQLGQDYHVPIQTPALASLTQIAQDQTWTAKISGAGGGDCGLALKSSVSSEDKVSLRQAWQEAGLEPLSLQVAPRKETHHDK